MKTKKYYSDRTFLMLQDIYPQSDNRVQEREIWRMLDDVVNSLARDNYFENWKLYGAALDEAFVTTWDGGNAISVVDIEGQQSYLQIPSNYIALPKHGGIVEVWPTNFAFGQVHIRDHADVRRTRRLMSGGMQGELGGYPKGMIFEFDQVDVGKLYSDKFGMRLAIRDSSQIAIDSPYPVAADKEEEVIQRVVDKIRERRVQPTDTVRDKNDAPNRT
jgi:hypothetical protein